MNSDPRLSLINGLIHYVIESKFGKHFAIAVVALGIRPIRRILPNLLFTVNDFFLVAGKVKFRLFGVTENLMRYTE
jgi:hypothetical protein